MRSTGIEPMQTPPATGAGPHFNALKHGQYAKHTVLPGEDPVTFRRHRRALFHNYRPQTKDEADLVHMMAKAQWQLERYSPLGEQLDAQAVSPETDAAGRVCEPIAHQRLHSGMDVTVHQQRLSRMWHRARTELMLIQKMRRQGLVDGALKLPADCYLDTDGNVYGPVPRPVIVPLPEPDIAADSGCASDSTDEASGFSEKQQEKGGATLPFLHAKTGMSGWLEERIREPGMTSGDAAPSWAAAPPGFTVVSSC